ncbi:MAG: S9 family peptidase [Burkholderiales bacterium]|nr:S9 family peptidase [Burkholderiales bacterium]
MKQPYWARLLIVTLFACSVTAQSQTSTLPPVEQFFKLSNFGGAKISPDAKSVAMLMAAPNQRFALAIMDTSTNKLQVIARYSNLDITSINWINNNRLVYTMGDRQLADGERRMGAGLIALDKDGKNEREIIERAPTPDKPKFRVLSYRYQFHSVVGNSHPDDIYVVVQSGTRKTPAATLLRVNTVDGVATGVNGPANASDFLIDSDGELRVATRVQESRNTILYNDPKTKEWRTLAEFEGLKEDGFQPAAIGPDGSFYVTAHNGGDTSALFKYDLENNKINPTPLITLEGFDFNGNIVFSKRLNKILGIRYETDASANLWLDDDIKKIQNRIDTLLPKTVNHISVPRENTDVVLVASSSDTQPGMYLLYYTSTGQLSPLGVVRPDINENQMSQKTFIRIKARDGLEIPTYLTLPRNSNGKNLPLIVMVHGGPYVRGGHWNWNPETQFLASRGYAVIEPDFRGSEGYGKKLFQSGWKQWGLKMQDDLDDVRKWAVDQSYADPERVCIAGASYGGYAVLIGLIRNPELYRCGISWVGVSDINLLYDVAWSDNSEQYQKYGMPSLIGDQITDAAQLKATSPLEQAARLKSPLILAYGAADRRVPLVHGTKLYDAIKDHNKQVEWIVYKDEAHGWRRLDNNIDFWTRVEKFLETNIGNTAKTK